MNDRLIECSRCGSDSCYVQEINLDVNLYWCYGCGFTSNTAMKMDSEFLKEQMDILPELYKSLIVEDETGKIWIPSTVNIPNKGMIFANGTGSNNWKWTAVLAVPVKEEEKEKFKLKSGGYAEWRMDMSTQQHFEERDYIEALSYLGLLSE